MSTVAEQPAVLELLSRFVLPNHELLKSVLVVHNYRGDCTETGDRRLRAMLGAAYESLHFDTVACDGRVLVIVPRCKAPGAVEIDQMDTPRFLTAPHYWALGQIGDGSPEVTPARASTISRVPVEIARSLHALPGLKFVDVRDVHYWEHVHGRAKKKKKPAPQDVVYFRFEIGYGAVLARALGGAAT